MQYILKDVQHVSLHRMDKETYQEHNILVCCDRFPFYRFCLISSTFAISFLSLQNCIPCCFAIARCKYFNLICEIKKKEHRNHEINWL